MCLIFVSHGMTEGYPLVVAANRDEFYDRAASPAAFWDDHPDILAGRDLVARGTWLGVSRGHRFAALTNFRSGLPRDPNAPSRGDLVRDFLTGTMTPMDYLDALVPQAGAYAGFSLLAYAGGQLAYFSNQNDEPHLLEPGLYGLSNELLDTPWPKVVQGKAAFGELLGRRDWRPQELLDLMADKGLPPDHDLPDTGVGLERERMLAPMMVTGDTYGTRCSTAIRVAENGPLEFVERSYVPIARPAGDVRFEVD